VGRGRARGRGAGAAAVGWSLGLAGLWAGAQAVPRRRRPVRSRAAPGDRDRRLAERERPRAGDRCRCLRRHRSEQGPSAHATDRERLLGHASAPRPAGSPLGHLGRGRRRPRGRRAGRAGRSVRVPRRAADGRAARVRRPALPASRARRARARPRAGAGIGAAGSAHACSATGPARGTRAGCAHAGQDVRGCASSGRDPVGLEARGDGREALVSPGRRKGTPTPGSCAAVLAAARGSGQGSDAGRLAHGARSQAFGRRISARSLGRDTAGLAGRASRPCCRYAPGSQGPLALRSRAPRLRALHGGRGGATAVGRASGAAAGRRKRAS
jgi:hypothetical protein